MTNEHTQQAQERFGYWLREMRKRASIGLRQFALMIDDVPSNVCNLENGKRPIPTSEEKLRKMAKVLGIRENSEDWDTLFGLAQRPGQSPADLARYTNLPHVPTLLRTIGEYQLDADELQRLLKYVQRNFGKGRSNDKSR